MSRFLVALQLAYIALCGVGGAAELTADQVMRRGIKNVRVPTESSRIKMTLINRQGQKRERLMSIDNDTSGKGDKSLARFLYPGGIRGTALLSVEDSDGKDRQWLYMPVLGRVRRIATTEMGDSFMGSELAYEDTKILHLEDWKFKMLGKEKIGGRLCWVIESRPAPRHETSYGKTKTWVEMQSYVALKTLFYDKKGRETKHIVSTGIHQASPGIWRPRRNTFVSLVTGQQTIMDYEKISINISLDKGLFDPRRLSQWQ
jgi:hypothetical protein